MPSTIRKIKKPAVSYIAKLVTPVKTEQVLFFAPVVSHGLWKALEESNLPEKHEFLGKRAIGFVDAKVLALYQPQIVKGLSGKPPRLEIVAVPEGERAKSLSCLGGIIRILKAQRALRNDTLVVALGGGATLDAVSLAASLYQRGLNLIHVPTTLISMLDATLGGKTAVNAFGIKNLIGTFYPPRLSLIDTDFLQTLEQRRIREGLIEALKMAFLAGEKELSLLLMELPSALRLSEESLRRLIVLCLKIKARFVGKDLLDLDRRRELNFGHTVGHALEAAKRFRLLHGEAVGVGMLFACHLARKFGIAQGSALLPFEKQILSFGIKIPKPRNVTAFISDLWTKIEMDKKAKEEHPCFILPVKPGEVRLIAVDKAKFVSSAKAFF